jgi:hypothetical protein
VSQSPVVYLIHLLRKARHFTAGILCDAKKKRKDSFFAHFLTFLSSKRFFLFANPHFENTVVTSLLIRGHCLYAITIKQISCNTKAKSRSLTVNFYILSLSLTHHYPVIVDQLVLQECRLEY